MFVRKFLSVVNVQDWRVKYGGLLFLFIHYRSLSPLIMAFTLKNEMTLPKLKWSMFSCWESSIDVSFHLQQSLSKQQNSCLVINNFGLSSLFYYCAISLYIYSYPSVKGFLLLPGMRALALCFPACFKALVLALHQPLLCFNYWDRLHSGLLLMSIILCWQGYKQRFQPTPCYFNRALN